VKYPAALPITDRRDELLETIAAHQVVIVAGETGSGKSTQLPKMCLELGRGADGKMIGHTQPRRIAARSVAERVADELDADVGGVVGYAVRFTDRVGPQTRLKLMTDGILLAELQRDKELRRYDTLIVDEAHERSLNIDFILGYLTQLLPRRPDLRLIVTSATIDTERFAQHFGGAPVVEVSGRSYPVEVRYRPLGDDDDDQVKAIGDAVDELSREGPGDVLVFLSGEREIRDTADALAESLGPDVDILPLYARLTAAEQHRVFQPHRGRRIVLATNVAETSLTVPGIRYVVDAGFARISRYNRRTKVQRLPIERISQASADQRAGRCGRVAPGIAVRLYDEDDFASRPEFTEPEILRTNLASVILQMAAIGLGDVAAFPFVDPPDNRSIKDGVALLQELGALDQVDPQRLTKLGRRLARLPLDPRLGRMVLAAEQHGCVHEVLVIAAALSIQDPRERPSDRRAEADESHARFADPRSDFLALVRLWHHLRDEQSRLSSSRFRKLCRAEFLNYLRVREWQDLHGQLRQVVRQLGVDVNRAPADADAIHRALLPGLLSHLGVRRGDTRDYQGARNAVFAIAPGSSLFGRGPRWIMAGELVETNRMWARVVAQIQPEWAERAGSHLVVRSYSEPHWDAGRGAAVAFERVTLFGLPIVERRRVDYARIDHDDARGLFLRHALVERDWSSAAHHRFLDENASRIDDVRALEDRVRRRDLLVDEDALVDWYDERVPKRITNGREFDRWWRDARVGDPDQLTFPRELLAGDVDLRDYPDVWRQGDVEMPLVYEFDPLSPTDGVTVVVPLPLLSLVDADGFDWHIPGLRGELVAALVRSLPKGVRRHFTPVREVAAALEGRISPDDGPLLDVLARELARTAGEPVSPADFQLDALPPYLRVTFDVVDEDGVVVATGKDLDALRRRLHGRLRDALADAAPSIERTGLTSWTIGTLPRCVESRWGGHAVAAYPALVDEGATVGVRLLADEADQARAMRAGTRRLLRLVLPSPTKAVSRLLSRDATLGVARAKGRGMTVGGVFGECVDAAIDVLVARGGGPAWDEAAFDALRRRVADDLVDTVVDAVTEVAGVLVAADAVDARLARLASSPGAAAIGAVGDVRAQLGALVRPGFVVDAGVTRLADVRRYVDAMSRRLDRLTDPRAAAVDDERRRVVRRLELEYHELVEDWPPTRDRDELAELPWMLQELRVSLFAQALGTAYPVSEQRIVREMDRLAAGAG
jgi:ATP-dependent helicase HrpA